MNSTLHWKVYAALFPLFSLLLRIASWVFPRVKKALSVRASQWPSLEARLTAYKPRSNGLPPLRLWIHAASVGEFEQARPIIESLHHHYSLSLFISFLSPSGYEARKSFPGAVVFYLPEDTPANAEKLMECLRPDIWVVIRYDLWPNHVREAVKRNIPILLISATMRESSRYFFPVIKGFYKTLFSALQGLLAADEQSANAFEKLLGKKVDIGGDPRFDQVLQRAETAEHLMAQKLGRFGGELKARWVFVLGSSWPQDEEIVLSTFKKLTETIPKHIPLSLILVPHEVDPVTMSNTTSRVHAYGFSPLILRHAVTKCAKGEEQEMTSKTVIIVDEMGYLMELYSLAKCAYVGGGFGVHCHNVLEPAVFGIPVVFGKKISRSIEAQQLSQKKAALHLTQESSAAARLFDFLSHCLSDDAFREDMGKRGRRYVIEQQGATERVIVLIKTLLNN